LDLETSGLLVVAKTDPAHRALQRAFADRRVRKTYVALVWGRPDPPRGSIDRGIGRSRTDRTRMAVDAPRARPARTTFRTLETLPGFSLLEISIETGRTHQIRVHLQSIHHPVVGDARYGGQRSKDVRDGAKRSALRAFHRLALHASDLTFVHPATGREVSFHAPLPEEMEDLLRALRSGA
jgi:23S rRNA pseudouridine1911/1915/1917 synthase